MFYWEESARPGRYHKTCELPPADIEFLPEGPGTGFLQKKRVPGSFFPLQRVPPHSRLLFPRSGAPSGFQDFLPPQPALSTRAAFASVWLRFRNSFA